MNKQNLSQELKLRILDYMKYTHTLKAFKTTDEENTTV